MTRTKGSLHSQCSIIEYTALIETVLINERSILNKGASSEDINKIVLKMTTHPRAECSGNSLVVGR